MANEFHLTKAENRPNDYRVIQGAKYDAAIYYPADITTYTLSAQIRRKFTDTSTLAVWNFTTPIYDPLYEFLDSSGNVIATGATIINLFLSASQTSALPVTTRTDNQAATPGANVWVWDCEAANPADAEEVIKLVAYSWVEVIPEVTR